MNDNATTFTDSSVNESLNIALLKCQHKSEITAHASAHGDICTYIDADSR